MNRTTDRVIRIIAFLLVMVVLRGGLILAIDRISQASGMRLEMTGDGLDIPTTVDQRLYFVQDDRPAAGTLREWQIRRPPETRFVLVLGYLSGRLSLRADGQVLHQTEDPEADGYSPSLSTVRYVSDRIVSPLSDTVTLSLSGDAARQATLYVASESHIRTVMELRLSLQAVMLTILLFLTGIAIGFRLFNRTPATRYILFFSLMGLTSILKAVNAGNVQFLARLIHLSAEHSAAIDRTMTFFNLVWPILFIASVFDLKIPKRVLFPGLLIYSALLMESIVFRTAFPEIQAAMGLTMLINMGILLWGFVHRRELSGLLTAVSLIYSTLTLYYTGIVTGRFDSGPLDFLINPAYLGVVIYLSGFFLVLFIKYVRYLRRIEQERLELDRVRLLQGINHDLNLPLSVIKLNSQMIERYEMSRGNTLDCARAIVASARDLETMTANMSEYLSLRQVDEQTDLRGCDLASCLDKLERHYQIYRQQPGFSFTVDQDDQTCCLAIEELHLCRMLYNLIDNAFKHNPDGVDVRVRSRIGQSLTLEVEDNGRGIPPQEHQTVFRPFHRLDHSRSVSGMGLGLVVVQRVVEQLGGTIRLYTPRDGRGIGIRIRLPLDTAPC